MSTNDVNTERVRFLVDGEHLIEVGASESVDALGVAVAAAVGVTLPLAEESQSFVLALDPSRWVQVECRQDYPISRWLAGWSPAQPLEPGAPIPATTCLERRCMHSSPAVPGLGYACGWC